ncbi:LuxR C-terminal-related transcriptional regulator [Crystallibacter degradans]|uniref:LuxR C-terminal-related transcriptional regulator n=1 Tax=Crystallibacter degradans TaxID=2726743 RepID=UPI001474C77F|nr:LuxR C-terminal-related transcriptional regulator [Arthrobacter sp. SF27]NMR28224.1 AAA family ATPase [Arthrobacter sp. SF27]
MSLHDDWPYFDDLKLVKTLEQAILNGQGAAVLGESGVGKTALVRHVLERLNGRIAVFFLKGKGGAGAEPLAALYPLVSQLNSEVLGNQFHLLRHLEALIDSRANGLLPVLYVDHGEFLDDVSAAILAQLCMNKSITLVGTFDDTFPMGEEAAVLCHDDKLAMVRLEPLSMSSAAVMLAVGLRGPTSFAVVQELWKCSNGNQRLIKALALEWKKSGHLKETPGGWILSGTVAPLDGHVSDIWKSRLALLTAGQRSFVELIALSEELPLGTALQLTDPADLDAVYEQGLLRFSSGHPVRIRMRNDMAGPIVRSQVPPGRSRRLLESLVSLEATNGHPPIGPIPFVSWQMSSGCDVDEETLLAAAEEANRIPDGRAAIKFLSAAKSWKSDPSFVSEMVRGLINEGRIREADQLLFEHYRKAGEPSDIEQFARLKINEARLLRFGRQLAPECFNKNDHNENTVLVLKDVADRVQARVDEADEGNSVTLHDLCREIEIIRLEADAYEGDYSQSIRRLKQAVKAEGPDQPSKWHLTIRLNEAKVITGSADNGLHGAQKLAARLSQIETEPAVHEAVHATLFNLHFIAGNMDTCWEIARSPSADAGPCDITVGALDEGLAYAMSGLHEDALLRLIPEIYQLRERDPHGILNLAISAAAYAYALSGNAEEAHALLHETTSIDMPASWKARRIALYFSALAAALIDSREPVLRTLLQAAEEDRILGNTAFELLALSAAARIGGMEAAERLAPAAAGAQGRFAALCSAYGRALSRRDGQALLDVARGAADLGHQQFAIDAANQAADAAAASGDSDTAEAARLFQPPQDNLALARLENPVLWDGLTPRQRDIALHAAAGESNRTIAQALQLSIRTVEGHLYQIYSRLNVSGRNELQEVLSRSSRAS